MVSQERSPNTPLLTDCVATLKAIDCENETRKDATGECIEAIVARIAYVSRTWWCVTVPIMCSVGMKTTPPPTGTAFESIAPATPTSGMNHH